MENKINDNCINVFIIIPTINIVNCFYNRYNRCIFYMQLFIICNAC